MPQSHNDSNDAPSTSAVHRATQQMQAQGLTPRPVFMPETFTGVGREWSDWSEQFDLAAEVNQWDESLKLKFMSLLLAGRARDMYSGLTREAKNNYELLKAAMTRCFEPCDSDDWSRASFTARRRRPNETAREFGNALRRLAARAYPTADECTRDMLARDQFILHFATGDFRVSLRGAKPKTLEDAIDLSSEMELLRDLEQTYVTPEARVRGVAAVTRAGSEEQMGVLLGVVEELRQEVRSLQSTVKTMQSAQKGQNPPNPTENPDGDRRGNVAPRAVTSRGFREVGGSCWECGCNRHLRRDCPYLQGN